MTDALDGNAIGGLLRQVFGFELTTARGVCAHCGAAALVAELEVYVRAPGPVVRCRACHGIVMVLVERGGVFCVNLQGLAQLDLPASA
jgi:hypothetical protein